MKIKMKKFYMCQKGEKSKRIQIKNINTKEKCKVHCATQKVPRCQDETKERGQ